MRLEVIEVPKRCITYDRESTGGHRCFIELKAPLGANDDSVEALVFPCGATTGPGVGGGDIRSEADGIRTDDAPWLQHPFGLVLPKLGIGNLEYATVLCLEARRTRVAMAPITEERELAFFDIETLEHFLGLPEVRSAPAHQGERVAHEAIDARINAREVADRGDVAWLRYEREGFRTLENL